MYFNEKGKGKHNIVKVGDVFNNTDGQTARVIEYINAKSVIVTFNHDGVVMRTCSSNLRRGNFRHPNKFEALVGKRFQNKQGDWASILEYKSAINVLIEFDGYPNNLKTVPIAELRRRSFKNNYKPVIFGVGYLGDGDYKGSKKDGTDLVYNVWVNMLARNYDTYTQTKQPAYIGCSVDKRWHNFQVFADFYINHPFYGLGYHLDKDLLVRGNRIYSPETCTMLPPEINSALSNTPESESGLPLGVNKIDDGYVARLNKTGQGREYLGYYKTAQEAHEVYVKAKEDYIHSLAEKWKGKIEDRAYQALLVWKVYPEETPDETLEETSNHQVV